jgi:hypothetical protein
MTHDNEARIMIQRDIKHEIATLEVSLIPKNNKNTGNMAVAGSERKKWTITSLDWYAFLEAPSNKPIGIHIPAAIINPKTAFAKVCQILIYHMLDDKMWYALLPISSSEGKSILLKIWSSYIDCRRKAAAIGLIIL